MAEHSESYWNDLLDQYKSGVISELDRYALEKRALDDPFLFDALEGYSLYGNEEAKPEKSKSRIFTLPRIAAAASLVFLVSTIFLLKNNQGVERNENQSIAMVLDDSADEQEEIEDPDNISDLSVVVETADEPGEESKIERAENISEATAPSERIKEQAKPEPPTSRQQKREKKESETSNSPQAKEEKIVETTHEDTEVVFEEEEETILVAKEKAFQDIPNKSSNTQMYDTNLELSEVVDANEVNAPSAKAKKKVKDEEVLAIYDVVPGIGAKDFEMYAAQKIKERGLNQTPQLEIVIEFTVDKYGMPTKFTHIVEGENVCPECAGFAISILSQSGVWIIEPKGTVGRARYTFKF